MRYKGVDYKKPPFLQGVAPCCYSHKCVRAGVIALGVKQNVQQTTVEWAYGGSSFCACRSDSILSWLSSQWRSLPGLQPNFVIETEEGRRGRRNLPFLEKALCLFPQMIITNQQLRHIHVNVDITWATGYQRMKLKVQTFRNFKKDMEKNRKVSLSSISSS